jgi:hypothetical protein
MMDKNLSWTSSLGEAYVNGSADVLDAVQTMRLRAQQAGNLKSTPQEYVTTQGDTIMIEPADPQVVYVPEYDPWIVYGDPIAFYPDWIDYPGFFFDGPGIEFGLGIGIGLFGGFGWGWHHWGTDWHGHGLTHGDHPYLPHSREFGNRGGFASGRGASAIMVRPRACVPVHSAASIMAGKREILLPAGERALVAAFKEGAASMVEEVVTDEGDVGRMVISIEGDRKDGRKLS